MKPNAEQFDHTRVQQNVDQFSHYKIATAPDGGNALLLPGGNPSTDLVPRIIEMGGDEIARRNARMKKAADA